jgi:VWFA-related protein
MFKIMTFLLHRFEVLVIMILLVPVLNGGAQDQTENPPGTIKVKVELVPVNIQVRDKNGKPLTGLQQSEFEIWENGGKQEIRHFEEMNLTPASQVPSLRDHPRLIPLASMETPSRRTFLILLGRGKHQHPFGAIDALLEFVKNKLLPQDQIALFAYNRASPFTNNRQKTLEILERYKNSHEMIEDRISMLQSGLGTIFGSKILPEKLQRQIDDIFMLNGNLEARQMVSSSLKESSEMKTYGQRAGMALLRKELEQQGGLAANSSSGSLIGTSSPDTADPAYPTLDLDFNKFVSLNDVTVQDLESLFTSIEYLRFVEGEKHLVYFTERGLFLPRLEHEKSIAAMANDARVVIDTIATGGRLTEGASGYLASVSTSGQQAESARNPASLVLAGNHTYTWTLAGLEKISQMTGGQSFWREYPGEALDQLNRNSLTGYLLGYYPQNQSWNGEYRRIEVKMKRRDARVRSRQGYYARPGIAIYDHETFQGYWRLTTAANYPKEVKDIPFKATAMAQNTPGGGKNFLLNLGIEAQSVPFHLQDGLYAGKLEIAVIRGDSSGKPIGEPLMQTLTMTLRESTYQRIQTEGIPFSLQVPGDDADPVIKVVVYNYEKDKIGIKWAKILRGK